MKRQWALGAGGKYSIFHTELVNDITENSEAIQLNLSSLKDTMRLNSYKNGIVKTWDSFYNNQGEFHTEVSMTRESITRGVETYEVLYTRKVKIMLVDEYNKYKADYSAVCRCLNGQVTLRKEYKTYDDTALIILPIILPEGVDTHSEYLVKSFSIVKALFADSSFGPNEVVTILGGRPDWLDSRITNISISPSIFSLGDSALDELGAFFSETPMQSFATTVHNQTLHMYVGEEMIQRSEYIRPIDVKNDELSGLHSFYSTYKR